MARVYPKDSEEKLKERESFQIFFSLLDMKTWEYLGSDHNDHGVDYTFEYIEDSEYKGFRILAQLKSRTAPIFQGTEIVFDFPVKTANYAISCPQPFVFFLIDLTERKAYYLPLQDYFIANQDKMEALENNKKSIRVFLPMDNTLDDEELKVVAKSQYTFDEENGLRKTR